MLEFVDSDLYFVQDKNNFINPLLQVGSDSVEKITGSGWPKITGSDRIRISHPCEKQLCLTFESSNKIKISINSKDLLDTLYWIFLCINLIKHCIEFNNLPVECRNN